MFDWLQYLTNLLTVDLFGLSRSTRIGEVVNFFFFDTAKIFLLLAVIIFVITVIRSFFSPEKTRALLAAKKGNTFVAHILAGLLGIVTPFCSCSAVPLFIGFVEAGVPLGVTFTYLVAAPMVNEVALGLLFSLFGFKIAAMYVVTGELIAIGAGLIIGKLKLERYVEDYVWKMKVGSPAAADLPKTWGDRIKDGLQGTVDIIKKVWMYVIIGIAIGAVMHGWLPTGALSKWAGPENPFAVIVAVLVGIPLYSNAAGIIPLVSELMRAGVAMGTGLALMMAVTALSIPEIILLRKVLKPRLLAIFVAIVGLGIIATGYLFNAIIH